MKNPANTFRNDLTEGSISKSIILFALPLLGSSLIQQLYNTVDLLFVGNLLGTNSYAAVGASSLIITCLVSFFTGMSVGSNVVTAQAIGRRDKKGIHDSVHTAVALSIIGGAVLMIVGEIGAPYFLTWMNTDPKILGESVQYLRIYFISLIPMITYNMSSGIIRATGNSAVPLFIQTAGGLANVAADAAFLFLRNDVRSVAWATMLSQTFAGILCLIYLNRRGEEARFSIRELRMNKELLKEMIRTGAPAGLQNFAIVIANISAQYRINSRGIIAISAFTTYFRVELLIYHPIVAIGQAMTTFAGQNMGAGKTERIHSGVKISIRMGIVLSIAAAVVLLIFGRPLFALFDADPQAVAEGQKIIQTTFMLYWLYVILEVLADTLRGSGFSFQPMILILMNICVLRTVLLIFVTPLWDDIRSIAMTYPITWAATAICMVICYRKKMPRIKKAQDA